MKRVFILITVLILLCFSSVYAVTPVTITNPDGSKSYSSGNAIETTSSARAIEQSSGSKLFHLGSCRVLSVSFFSSDVSDVVAIYNSDGAALITDLEFEFDIGISANTSIKTNETIDCKGAKFERGLQIITGHGTIRSTVIYDY